jgi:hypothetical protein
MLVEMGLVNPCPVSVTSMLAKLTKLKMKVVSGPLHIAGSCHISEIILLRLKLPSAN